MDNIGDISKSYFINKNTIKNKVKKRMKRIIYYQEIINTIIQDNKYLKKLNSYDKQSIELCEEIINDYKNKNKRDTNIYFY